MSESKYAREFANKMTKKLVCKLVLHGKSSLDYKTLIRILEPEIVKKCKEWHANFEKMYIQNYAKSGLS